MITLKPKYYSPEVTSPGQTGWIVDLTNLSMHQRENEIFIELNDAQCRDGIKIIKWD